MTYFSKIILYLTFAVLILWKVPQGINMLLMESYRSDFTLWSALEEDFLSLGNYDGKMKYYSRGGRNFSEQQFDSLLPAFYVRQLVTDGRFPIEVKGVTVTPQLLVQHNFNFRVKPSDINAPQIGLYSLQESMSKRVQLEMPSDVFRLTDEAIEFIDMDTNSLDEEKSDTFTSALKKKGFVFPAAKIAGNPSTRKEYDNGYMLIDANGQVFNLRMTVGRPYVRLITTPESITPQHVFVTEFSDRANLGFMTDSENNMYVITKDNSVKLISGLKYKPERDAITIFGNLFDWTIRLVTDTHDNYYAISADNYECISTKEKAVDSWNVPSVSFTSYDDKFVKIRF